MEYATLGVQITGGILGALLAHTLIRSQIVGFWGSVVVGIVGGAISGLVLAGYLALAPATLADGSFASARAILAQAAAGAAGGAVLMLATGYLTRRDRQ